MKEDQDVRFKCLELAVKTTIDTNEQIARAKIFESFVNTGKSPQDKNAPEVKHPQKVGNVKVLP
jgi:hypothetical protein